MSSGYEDIGDLDFDVNAVTPAPEPIWQYRYAAGLFRMSWEAAGAYGLNPVVPVEPCPPADQEGVGWLRNGHPGMNITVVGPGEIEPAASEILGDPTLNLIDPSVFDVIWVPKDDRIDAVFSFPVTKKDPPETQRAYFDNCLGRSIPEEGFTELASEKGFAKMLGRYLTRLAAETAAVGFDSYLTENGGDEMPARQRSRLITDYAEDVWQGVSDIFFQPGQIFADLTL